MRIWTALVFVTFGLMTVLPAWAEGLADPRDAMKIFVEATAAGDADAIAALYTPNAIMLAPNTPVIGGREAIRAVFKNNFAAGPNTIEFGNFQLDGSGNRALIVWTWRSQILPANREPIRILGRSMVYFSRAEGEGWLISADMFQPANAK